MRRQDLPLLLSSNLAAGEVEPHPLDRIRMQKAVFLLVQRGSSAWSSMYSYRPYDWGPYSGQLVADVEDLQTDELLKTERVRGNRYGSYSTTLQGEKVAEQRWAALSPTEQEFFRVIRRYVTTRSFRSLLRDVYAAYPDYATKSRFGG